MPLLSQRQVWTLFVAFAFSLLPACPIHGGIIGAVPGARTRRGALDTPFPAVILLIGACIGHPRFSRKGTTVTPQLSSVTYLTDVGAPTCVAQAAVDATGNMVPPGDGHSFYLSHPRRGKHVVFDGGLLHCVPATLSCRAPSSPNAAAAADAVAAADRPSPPHAPHGGSGGGRRRATVLVNVWLNYRPAATAALPQDVRTQLTALAAEASVGLPASTDGLMGAPLLGARSGGEDDGEELQFGYSLVGPEDGTTLTLVCRVPGIALAPAAAGATFELPLLDVPLPTSRRWEPNTGLTVPAMSQREGV